MNLNLLFDTLINFIWAKRHAHTPFDRILWVNTRAINKQYVEYHTFWAGEAEEEEDESHVTHFICDCFIFKFEMIR